VFSCRNERLVHGFRLSAKASGFVQLWPPPLRFWPIKRGTAKFPSQLVLQDEQADEAADSYNEKIKALTVTPDKAR
jgi:hypothetical protein